MPPSEELDEPKNGRRIKFIFGGTLVTEAPDLCLVGLPRREEDDEEDHDADFDLNTEEPKGHEAAEVLEEEDPFADLDLDNNIITASSRMLLKTKTQRTTWTKTWVTSCRKKPKRHWMKLDAWPWMQLTKLRIKIHEP